MSNAVAFINHVIKTGDKNPTGYDELSSAYKTKLRHYIKRLKSHVQHKIEQDFESFTEMSDFVIEIERNGFSKYLKGEFTKQGVSFKNHTIRLRGLNKHLSKDEVTHGVMNLDVKLKQGECSEFIYSLTSHITALNLAGIRSINQYEKVLSDDNKFLLHKFKHHFEGPDLYVEFLNLVALVFLSNIECEGGDISQLKSDLNIDPSVILGHIKPMVDKALSNSITEGFNL